MAELTTIARPYAEAAFRIASDANALPAWSEMLHFLCDVTTEPSAAAALDNPKLTAADKTALLLSIGGERLDAPGRSFVRVLVEADRIAVLPQIRTLFEALKNDADGVAEARIDTAFPLTDAQAAELKAALEKRFGRKIDATVHVDPALNLKGMLCPESGAGNPQGQQIDAEVTEGTARARRTALGVGPLAQAHRSSPSTTPKIQSWGRYPAYIARRPFSVLPPCSACSASISSAVHIRAGTESLLDR